MDGALDELLAVLGFETAAASLRKTMLTSTSQYAKIEGVRIISRKKIREASEHHSEWAASLDSWYKIAKAARWSHFSDLKQTWSRADKVGACVVFDVCHNKCRLIVRIKYERQLLFIRHILTHAEYDKGGWKHDCDCD